MKHIKDYVILGAIGVIVVVSSIAVSYDGTYMSEKLSKFFHTDVSSIVKHNHKGEAK